VRRRSRDIGTAAERAVVCAILTRGFPHAERRALRGTQDAGDITGTPGICWSVKGGQAARTASDGQIEAWLGELDEQTTHAGADLGVLVLQRTGVGENNAHRWRAILRCHDMARLASFVPRPELRWFPVRVLLADACTLLRAAGYGTPEDVPTGGAAEPGPPPAGTSKSTVDDQQMWAVQHPGLGILPYGSEEAARVAAGTAGTLLTRTPGSRTWEKVT
jgi:hypothetical protein